MRKGRTTWTDLGIGLRMLAWAAVLVLLLRVLKMKLPRAVRLMRPRRAFFGHRNADRELRISSLAHVAADLVGRADSNCLIRSLLAWRYLGLAGASPHIVAGMERSEKGVRGHAWVLVDYRPLGEASATLASFLPVVAFDERGLPYQVPSSRGASEKDCDG
ncbi:MAG: lasso peptide biosynthesis B2 protein [Vicinamibacterales bacterium]